MRHLALLMAIGFSTGARAQSPPDHPQPAQAPLPEAPAPPQTSAMWDRIERLPRGQSIKIRIDEGRWEKCGFAGATDAFLYCAREDGPSYAQEWQIERLKVSDFKLDHDVRNGRLVYAGVVVGSALALGIRAAQTSPNDPQLNGVIGGLIGAGLGALVGIPFSCLAGHCVTLHPPAPFPMAYGGGVNVPLPAAPWHRR